MFGAHLIIIVLWCPLTVVRFAKSYTTIPGCRRLWISTFFQWYVHQEMDMIYNHKMVDYHTIYHSYHCYWNCHRVIICPIIVSFPIQQFQTLDSHNHRIDLCHQLLPTFRPRQRDRSATLASAWKCPLLPAVGKAKAKSKETKGSKDKGRNRSSDPNGRDDGTGMVRGGAP